MMTNQQAVVNAETEISRIKEVYNDCLKKIVMKLKQSNSPPSLEELLELQEKSIKLFNYTETFVGQSGLLGAHNNGLWVTGFAETCYAVLEIAVKNYCFLVRHEHAFMGALQKPTHHAYANMQRMVKEYLQKDQYLKIKQEFKINGLPTAGFEFKEAPDVNEQGSWQPIVCVVISLLLMLIIMLFAYHTPMPSKFQIFIFRGMFALASALIAAIIPGFLSVESRWKSLKVRATGAIAIFVIIWFVNPPTLIQ